MSDIVTAEDMVNFLRKVRGLFFLLSAGWGVPVRAASAGVPMP